MLTVEHLSFSVENTRILKGISCKVEKGETVGVIGPNGSGKTTFFNCLSGFNSSTAGKIFFKEKDISHLGPSYRAREGIGRVFQSCGVFREMTVLENVLTALESREPWFRNVLPFGRAQKKNRERAVTVLEEVGLAQKSTERADRLSGGQMRLLEIARMLAFGAELFLLDEPTAGVSPRMKDEASHQIQKLRQLGKTVLVIEHDLTFIERFCQRILVFDSGEIVLDDTPEKVRSNKRLQEIYFGAEKREQVTPFVSSRA